MNKDKLIGLTILIHDFIENAKTTDHTRDLQDIQSVLKNIIDGFDTINCEKCYQPVNNGDGVKVLDGVVCYACAIQNTPAYDGGKL